MIEDLFKKSQLKDKKENRLSNKEETELEGIGELLKVDN